MKNIWKVIVITAIMMMGIATMTSAATTVATDVTTASSGCKMVGLEGEYIADCQAALNRINEIRKEACNEGLINPSTGKKLTSRDYVALKWSSDMEAIARIRAAESALTLDHLRTNGKNCFAIKSNGKASSGEVIAWNFSKTMLNGINQWYREKSAYVRRTGGVTGHYEAMIDPAFRYVGLGTFYTTKTQYYNTTVGEFSTSKSALDQTMGTSATVIQKLEVKTSASYYTSHKSIFKAVEQTVATTTSTPKVEAAAPAATLSVKTTKVSVKKGKTATLTVTAKNTTEKVTYKTSNKKVATVTSKGVIKGVKKGSAVITVTCGKLTKTVKVTVK